MRKIYLLLLALVACVGVAWAAPITELGDGVVGKVFTIKSADRGAFVYQTTYNYENAGKGINIKGADYVSGSTRADYGVLNNTDPNFLFAFVKSESNYYLYSIGAKKYCAYDANGVKLQTDTPGAGVAFLASTGGNKAAYPTVIAIDGSHQLNMSTDQNLGVLTSWNDTGDAGNMLAIEEVEGCVFNNETKAFTDNRITITYNFKYEGKVFSTQTVAGVVGNAYPTPTEFFGLEYAALEGTVKADDANTPIEIVCQVSGNFPFRFFSSFEEIDTWYAAKLHSNQTNYMYWTGEAIAFAGTLPAGDKAYGWAFVGNPVEGFKVYNNLAGENVVLNNSNPCSLSEDSEDKFYVKPGVPKRNSVADGYFTLKFDGQEYLNYQSGNIARWGDNDEGSTWKLEEIDLSVDAAAKQAKTDALALISASSILFGNPATEGTLAYTAKTAIEAYTYDKTSETEVAQAVAFYNSTVSTMCAAVDKDIVFYNTNRGNNYMVVTDAVQMSGAAANGTSIFHVKGVESTSHFTIQNKANGRYIANTPATSNRVQLSLTAGEFTIKSFGTDNKFAFISTNPADATHNSLHLDGSNRVVAWEADNEGSASVWVIQEPTNDLSVEEGTNIVKNQAWNPINTMKNNLGSVQIGNGLGQYNGDETTVTAFQTALNAIPTSIDGLDFEAVYALNTEKNNLQAAYNALSLTRPNGKAFTIKGKQNGRYLSSSAVELDLTNPADASVNRVQMVTEENADIYLLTADNGLVSYTAGLGFTISEKVAVPGTAINIMNFEKGNSAGYYVLRSDYAGNPYLYNRSDKTILCSNASKAGDNTDWTLTEVTALPIKMNAVGGVYYATFNAPVSVVIPEGLKAYSATIAESGDVLNLTKVAENGAVLAANTPVILYSEADVTALTISAEEGNAAASNDLSGTNQKITVTANENYVLGNKGGIGFYKYNNTTMPAFKAYLSSSSEAPAFSFSFGDMETAIKAIESDNSKAVIYDIAGRRVQKAAKGLYIVNGKKVMFN